MTGLTAAGLLVAACALGSGLLMVHARVALLAGCLTAAAGGTAMVGTWLVTGSAVGAGRFLLVAAWMVLAPAALWAYPRPRWRHPVDTVLGVALVAPGVLACLYTDDLDVITMLVIAATLALVAQTWWRLEHSDTAERRSVTWVALSSSVLGLTSLTLLFVAGGSWAATVAVALLAGLPLSMAVGVLRPDTVDVRGLVVTAAVGLAVGIGYLAYFAASLALLELTGAERPEPAVLAAIGLLGGVMLRPAALALRSVMDQMLFGDRPDPLDAATRVVGRIGRDPDEALVLIRDDLAIPYAALRRGPALVAAAGEPVSHVRRIVTADDVTLEVGLRPGDLRLSPGDERVLRLLAPLLAGLVRGGELSAELQESRAQALTGIADERRRLRRELHDGLGPTLTGIAFTTDAARNLVAEQPHAAADLLDEARRDTMAAIEQVRQIVYGMRPPAVDDLGLVAALRQQSRALGRVLEVRFQVDGDLSGLLAVVEVAAYRIVMEALTNVARHTGSASATVSLTRCDEGLVVEVTDRAGGEQPWRPGVGISSMRERATELGGTLHAGPGTDGGRVVAVLPLTQSSASDPARPT